MILGRTCNQNTSSLLHHRTLKGRRLLGFEVFRSRVRRCHLAKFHVVTLNIRKNFQYRYSNAVFSFSEIINEGHVLRNLREQAVVRVDF